MEINKQDKVCHETEVCEYRRVKCHDCGQIQEDVEILKRSLLQHDGRLEATNKKTVNYHVEMQQVVGKLEGRLMELDRKAEAMNTSQDQVKQDQQQVKKEVKDIKESLTKVNKDVDEIKVMMIQVLEKLNMLEQHKKLSSPTAGILNTSRKDILIAGGLGNAYKSTEIFSLEKNCWFEVSDLNGKHWLASSFNYNDQFFVVGGYQSKTIETLDLNELPLKWMKRSGKLPYSHEVHQTVVYQQRIIHIGGYNRDKEEQSGTISELQLAPSCTMRKLCEMPEPRYYHRAEIFEDKVMILGGQSGQLGSLNTVLGFDVDKKKCKKMPPLPYPLLQMATVAGEIKLLCLEDVMRKRKL